MEPGFVLPDGMVAISKEEARRRLGLKDPEPQEALDDLAWVDEWRATHEKQECTQEELDDLEQHPFFMKEMPADPLANPGLAALRELVVGNDQSPDEIANNLKQAANEFLRDRFKDPRGAVQAIRDAVQRYSDAVKVDGVSPFTKAVILSNRSQAHLHLQNFRSAGQDAVQADYLLSQLLRTISDQAPASANHGVAATVVSSSAAETAVSCIPPSQVSQVDPPPFPSASVNSPAPSPTPREINELRTKVLVRLAKAAADAPGPTASASALARAIAGVERAVQLLQDIPQPPAEVTEVVEESTASSQRSAVPAEVLAELSRLRVRLDHARVAEAATEHDREQSRVGRDSISARCEAALLAWGIVWAHDVADEVSNTVFAQWQQQERPIPSLLTLAAEDSIAEIPDTVAALQSDAAAVTVPVVVRWPEPRAEDFIADVQLAVPFDAVASQLLPPIGASPIFCRGERGYVAGNVEYFIAGRGRNATEPASELTQDEIISAIAAEPLDSEAARTRVKLDTSAPLGHALAAVGHVLRGQGTLVVYGVPKSSRLIKDGKLWI